MTAQLLKLLNFLKLFAAKEDNPPPFVVIILALSNSILANLEIALFECFTNDLLFSSA